MIQGMGAGFPAPATPVMTFPPLDPPFGTHALPAFWDRVRRRGNRVRTLKARSVLRKILMTCTQPPYDIAVFGDQKVRLYPADNRAERKVICGVQFFDPEERERLGAHVRSGTGPYVFVDAGANAGLYTLWMRHVCAEAGRPLTVVAIEPDPQTKLRLIGNLAANGADNVIHADTGLSDAEGTLRFHSGGLKNRGRARLTPDGDIEIPVRPLADVLSDHDVTRIDAMKIDIEGAEARVLSRFFTDAPDALHPELLQIETRHDEPGLPPVLEAGGYDLDTRHGSNSTFLKVRPAQRMENTDG